MNPNHAPKNGPHGIDRWSCNGYGLTINGKKVEPKPEDVDVDEPKESGKIDEIEEV